MVKGISMIDSWDLFEYTPLNPGTKIGFHFQLVLDIILFILQAVIPRSNIEPDVYNV